MILGRVVGTITSTINHPFYDGKKLMVVERGTHDTLLTLNGRYRQLYDKQYGFERDRFINPGEDFTPEPPKTEMPKPEGGGGPGR